MKTTTQNIPNNIKNNAVLVFSLVSLFSFHTQAARLNTNSQSKLIIETNRVWINVTDTQGAFPQTLMSYRSRASDRVDYGLDGAYVNDGALSFKASYNGIYTFAIDHLDRFFVNPSFAVYIHDTVTNNYNDLKTGLHPL